MSDTPRTLKQLAQEAAWRCALAFAAFESWFIFWWNGRLEAIRRALLGEK